MRSNAATAVHDVSDAGCWHADIHRKLVLANVKGLQTFFQQNGSAVRRIAR
jgi:hypothetical protein